MTLDSNGLEKMAQTYQIPEKFFKSIPSCSRLELLFSYLYFSLETVVPLNKKGQEVVDAHK